MNSVSKSYEKVASLDFVLLLDSKLYFISKTVTSLVMELKVSGFDGNKVISYLKKLNFNNKPIQMRLKIGKIERW